VTPPPSISPLPEGGGRLKRGISPPFVRGEIKRGFLFSRKGRN